MEKKELESKKNFQKRLDILRSSGDGTMIYQDLIRYKIKKEKVERIIKILDYLETNDQQHVDIIQELRSLVCDR